MGFMIGFLYGDVNGFILFFRKSTREKLEVVFFICAERDFADVNDIDWSLWKSVFFHFHVTSWRNFFLVPK